MNKSILKTEKVHFLKSNGAGKLVDDYTNYRIKFEGKEYFKRIGETLPEFEQRVSKKLGLPYGYELSSIQLRLIPIMHLPLFVIADVLSVRKSTARALIASC